MESPKAISAFISRALFTNLLLLILLPATAQQRKKVIAVVPDTIPMWRGVQVSGDVVGLIQLAVGSYGQYEGAVKVNLKDKFFPVIELGLGKADANDAVTQLTYKTSAPYGRIGMDFNLMKNKHDVYRLYGGFRYAYTKFNYDVSSPDLTDPIWGDKIKFEANDVACNYHWLEAVVAIDAKIWGPVRMGWSVRYKRRIAHTHGEIGDAWYVPGYGKAGNTRLGGTFNISIEI